MNIQTRSIREISIRDWKPISIVSVVYIMLSLNSLQYITTHVNLLRLEYGLAIPIGIIFGGIGVIAIAVGVIVSELIVHTPSTDGIFFIVTIIFSTFISYLFKIGGLTTHSYINETITPFYSEILENISIIIIVSVFAASCLAFFAELTAISPFYIAFHMNFALILFPSVIVLSMIMVLYFLEIINLKTKKYSIFSMNERLILLILPIIWATIGTIGSIGFRIGERFAPIGDHWLAVLNFIFEAGFGFGARRIQISFGTFIIILFLFILYNSQTKD